MSINTKQWTSPVSLSLHPRTMRQKLVLSVFPITLVFLWEQQIVALPSRLNINGRDIKAIAANLPYDRPRWIPLGRDITTTDSFVSGVEGFFGISRTFVLAGALSGRYRLRWAFQCAHTVIQAIYYELDGHRHRLTNDVNGEIILTHVPANTELVMYFETNERGGDEVDIHVNVDSWSFENAHTGSSP